MRGPRIDQRTQIFHFPVFHDSGSTDQWVENIAPTTQAIPLFQFQGHLWKGGKPEFWSSPHPVSGFRTSRTLFFQFNGIKCSEGGVESPAMWVFALPWGVWSYEITSGASVAGVGIPTLSCCRRKSFAGDSIRTHIFLFCDVSWRFHSGK